MNSAVDINYIKEKSLPELKKAGILKSSLFGSFARGEANSANDVDILVQLPDDKNLFDLIDLEHNLATALGKKIVQLPGEFKDSQPDIPWAKIAGLRNRLVHEYFDIDHKLVWNTLEKSLPEFKKQIEKLLEG